MTSMTKKQVPRMGEFATCVSLCAEGAEVNPSDVTSDSDYTSANSARLRILTAARPS